MISAVGPSDRRTASFLLSLRASSLLCHLVLESSRSLVMCCVRSAREHHGLLTEPLFKLVDTFSPEPFTSTFLEVCPFLNQNRVLHNAMCYGGALCVGAYRCGREKPRQMSAVLTRGVPVPELRQDNAHSTARVTEEQGPQRGLRGEPRGRSVLAPHGHQRAAEPRPRLPRGAGGPCP